VGKTGDKAALKCLWREFGEEKARTKVLIREVGRVVLGSINWLGIGAGGSPGAFAGGQFFVWEGTSKTSSPTAEL